jgi:hypothetical protein
MYNEFPPPPLSSAVGTWKIKTKNNSKITTADVNP